MNECVYRFYEDLVLVCMTVRRHRLLLIHSQPASAEEITTLLTSYRLLALGSRELFIRDEDYFQMYLPSSCPSGFVFTGYPFGREVNAS